MYLNERHIQFDAINTRIKRRCVIIGDETGFFFFLFNIVQFNGFTMDSNTYHTCIKSNAIIEYLCNPLCLNVEIIEESGHNV